MLGDNGFGALEGLLILVIITIIGGAGYYTYNSQSNNQKVPAATKADSNTQASNTKITPQDDKITIPSGWVAYTNKDTGVTFYHPPEWLDADLSVDKYDIDEIVPDKYGTPSSHLYDKTTKKWVLYTNYGDTNQTTSNDPEVKYITNSVTKDPIAYWQTGHAANVTHDILLIKEQKVYRIRLPEINTFDDGWEPLLQTQKDAVSGLIGTLSVK